MTEGRNPRQGTIGVGVLGCGDIAKVRFFPNIEAMPEFRLIGSHSRSPASCEPIVRQWGGRTYPDLDAFLRDPEIEAVIVATPHPSHAELSVRALEAGKHVLVEKPMATSLADAGRIRVAAERSGRVFLALPLDRSPAVDEAKRLIQSGVLGPISSADAVLAHGGPVHAPWFFDRKEAEWGVLADLGIYLISQLTYLFGPAQSVTGRVETLMPQRLDADGHAFPSTVDDNSAAILAWSDGFLASIRANWCSPADRRNIMFETRIHGTDGILFLSPAAPAHSLVIYSPGRPIEGAEEIIHSGLSGCYRPVLPAWDIHGDVLVAFAEAIAGGSVPEAEAARAHHVIDIIESLYRSSRFGAAQTLTTQY